MAAAAVVVGCCVVVGRCVVGSCVVGSCVVLTRRTKRVARDTQVYGRRGDKKASLRMPLPVAVVLLWLWLWLCVCGLAFLFFTLRRRLVSCVGVEGNTDLTSERRIWAFRNV